MQSAFVSSFATLSSVSSTSLITRRVVGRTSNYTSIMERAHTHRGCWNCKSLKIGCDQGFPSCQNCLQSKKACLGYRLRLSWPRASDRRRTMVSKQGTIPAEQMLSFRQLRFLNTTTGDVDLHHEIMQTGDYMGQISSRRLGPRSSHAIIKPMSTPWGVLEVGDQILLSYYEGVLSRMITTIDDDRNGFRHVLIKMALSDTCVSSAAVLQAILAFSAFHLSGSQAGIKHSFAAISALSSSMQLSRELRDRYYQLAASLVLTTYGVSFVSSPVRSGYDLHQLAPLNPSLV